MAMSVHFTPVIDGYPVWGNMGKAAQMTTRGYFYREAAKGAKNFVVHFINL
jgi:hypothetical protein